MLWRCSEGDVKSEGMNFGGSIPGLENSALFVPFLLRLVFSDQAIFTCIVLAHGYVQSGVGHGGQEQTCFFVMLDACASRRTTKLHRRLRISQMQIHQPRAFITPSRFVFVSVVYISSRDLGLDYGRSPGLTPDSTSRS